MQASTRPNGQFLQVGQQLQSMQSSPHFNHNTVRKNYGLAKNASQFVPQNTGDRSVVSHFPMHNGVNKQVPAHPSMSIQRNNFCLPANNTLQTSSRPDFHLNSAQTFSNQNHTPTVNLITMYCQQVIPAHSVSGQPSLAVPNGHTLHYRQHGTVHSALSQNTNLQAESIRANMTNPSSMMQTVYSNNQQQPVIVLHSQVAAQSQSCSESSQQAACRILPSYPEAVLQNNVSTAQNVQVYSVNSLMPSGVSASSLILTHKQCEQNSNVVSRTNELYPVHPVNGRKSVLCQMLNAKNTDNISSSLTTGPIQTNSNSHHNQEHLQHLTARGNRDMQSNHTTQSVILTANGSCTLNAPNPSGLLTVQSLPNSTYGISNLQNDRSVPPQTTLSTNDHSVNGPTGAANLMSCFYKRLNEVSNGNPYVSMTQPSKVNRCEVLNKLDTVPVVHPNDGSIHTSPGRALRAIAVVPPLSQVNQATPNSEPPHKTAPDSFFPDPTQLDIPSVPTQKTVCLKEPSQLLNNNCRVSTENADNVETSLKSLRELIEHDAGSKLAVVKQKDQCFAQMVNPSVKFKSSVRQKSATSKRKTPTEQNPCEKELLSLPTTEWTLEKLYKKITEMENTEKQHTNSNVALQIIYRFWNGNVKRLINDLRNGWYTTLMKDLKEFCNEHIKKDTVILSDMTSQSLPSRYCVLQHDEEYQEKSLYTSSWLNNNSQLDDIDKEFGFPWFLKYHQELDSESRVASPSSSTDAETHNKLKDNSHSEPENGMTDEDSSNQCGSGLCVANPSRIMDAETHSHLKDKSKPELKPVHSESEKHSRDEDTLKQCASPNELHAQQCDPSYSFKIEVMDPDVAKVIFDQIQCESPQKVDNSLSEKETISSENHDKPDDTEGESWHVSTVEKVCCVEKWKERLFGLSSEMQSKCKCQEQTQEEKPFIKDKEKQSQSQHNDNEYFWPVTTLPVDLSEDDDKTPIFALKEIGDFQESNNTNIIVINESEDELLNHTAHHEEDLEQALLMSAGTHQITTVNENLLEVHGSGVTISEKKLETEEDCRMEPEENGSETPEGGQTTNNVTSTPPTPVSPSDKLKDNRAEVKIDSDNLLLPVQLKKLKVPTHLKSQTILESFSKYNNVAAVGTVQLVLFGSTRENGIANSHRSNLLSLDTLSDKRPPRKISVKMSPLKRSETDASGDVSVKRRIHENWRNSFPPTKIRLKRKNKKFSILSASHVKTLSPTKNEDLKVHSKRKLTDASDSQHHKKKRRNGVKKTDNLVNAKVLKKPTNTEIRLQENVLKFKVLPKTFSFKVPHDGNTTDAAADKTSAPVKAEDKRCITKTKETWCEEPIKKSSPVRPASGPETKNLFQEFQKRYKMMTQMDKDE